MRNDVDRPGKTHLELREERGTTARRCLALKPRWCLMAFSHST